mgnify:CR=1 FL=1
MSKSRSVTQTPAAGRMARRNGLYAAFVVALGLGLLVSPEPAALAKEPIKVTLDRAKVMRIESPADTVIVGNPAIADAVMHDRTTLVVIGRGFGSTNLIILDENGEAIADETLVVGPQSDAVVTVQRRGLRYSYSCSPACAPTVNPGDEEKFFKQVSEQGSSRNAAAQEAASAKGN